MSGYYRIETYGTSTRGLTIDMSRVNKYTDKYGRFSHPVVQTVANNMNHKTGGKCAEIEAISWYLQEIERTLNVEIKTLKDARKYTDGTKMQTFHLKKLCTVEPCSPDGCNELLNIFGIEYIASL